MNLDIRGLFGVASFEGADQYSQKTNSSSLLFPVRIDSAQKERSREGQSHRTIIFLSSGMAVIFRIRREPAAAAKRKVPALCRRPPDRWMGNESMSALIFDRLSRERQARIRHGRSNAVTMLE